MTREERAPALYRRFLAGRPLLDEHGAEVPSAYMNCRNELAALLDALARCERLAEEWVTCDGVVMEDGEVVGPSPMVAKTLRHCADGVRAALRRALEGEP